MRNTHLGKTNEQISVLGLGCMGMSEFYGTHDDQQSISTIHRALDLGVSLLDTADMYGPFTNEKLVGRAIRDRRDRVIIATKFGNERREDGSYLGVNGRPVSNQLTRLSTTNCAISPRVWVEAEPT